MSEKTPVKQIVISFFSLSLVEKFSNAISLGLLIVF